MARHKVRPGITGLAQISGWRGNTSIPERIKCDHSYIRNWSFWLDLKIITLTLSSGVFSHNAY
jgi:lipopolysaccharide/colanic/teichoic acid biosynthesis glycosyltransferase